VLADNLAEPGPIRVLLVDDEALLRTGIRLILRHAPDIEVVGEAEDGVQAVGLVGRIAPDVVLMDIRMPRMDGLAALLRIRAEAPAVRVVMLTTFGEHAYVAEALRGGAAGFVLKDIGPRELIQAVRAAAGGSAILSPEITQRIVDHHFGGEPERATRARRLAAGLTDREREVLVAVGLGLSNAEAAKRLMMGEGTVKTHVSHILAKLGCANRVQAAILAHEAGFLPSS
jgi:DNA-binding NarL/FixJ family response regulator